MKEDITDELVKCSKCGKYYLEGLDGDSDVCDACIATNETSKPYLEGDCYGEAQ